MTFWPEPNIYSLPSRNNAASPPGSEGSFIELPFLAVISCILCLVFNQPSFCLTQFPYFYDVMIVHVCCFSFDTHWAQYHNTLHDTLPRPNFNVDVTSTTLGSSQQTVEAVKIRALRKKVTV